MNHTRARIDRNYFVSIAVTVALALSLTDIVSGQSRSRNNSRDVEAAARERQRSVQNRSMVMEHIGNDKKLNAERAELFARIREDFMRIQVVNNDMMQTISRNETLNYKLISDATQEINKCAKRLKDKLAVPDAEKDSERQNEVVPGVEQMKGSLAKLDNSIMSFVTSLGVVNTQDVNKVSRDLTDIIEISNSIRKNAQKLNKTSQLPQ